MEVQVRARPEADILLDGKVIGHATIGPGTIKLPPGDYTLFFHCTTVSAPDTAKKVHLEAGKAPDKVIHSCQQ